MIYPDYHLTMFDEAGGCIEILPDSEGLGLLEIKNTNIDIEKRRMMFSREEAEAIARGILKILELNPQIE